MDAKEFLNTALGGNMNFGTLKPLAIEEIMEQYSRHKSQETTETVVPLNDGLAGVLAEAKSGLAEARQMRDQYTIAKNKTREEFWRGEAIAFFRIITFIDKAS